jgi:cell division protein FtsN
MLLGVLVVALIAAAVAGGFYWLGSRGGGVAGEPELIRAPDTPYKVKPDNPGGLDIAGESQTTFETSAGQDVDSRLNLDATEGEDVTTTAPKETPKAPDQPAATPAPKPEPPKPAPSGAAGNVVQLGAFANRAQAERAWTALATRFPSVAGLNKMIVPFSGGIRLRAAASSSSQAQDVCKALKAAGEACFIAR